MCCHGCEAVARTIVENGYSEFYHRRSAMPLAAADPVPDFLRDVPVYDNPDVQAKFVDELDGGLMSVSLIIDGIACSACAWLIERRMKRTPGIVDVYVNYNTHRATVAWQPDRIRLSEILAAVRSIGYQAWPFDPASHQDTATREHRSFLVRLGITGALGMQVMMIATAMYFGESGGMEEAHRTLFRWLSLFLTIPIVFYCALPFFRGALRDIRNAMLGMDVPVSLGLGLAFIGSAWATWTGTGAVYYESVVMFVFLLLCARFLEARARHRSVSSVEALNDSVPDLAERRLPSGQWEPVLASVLLPWDLVRIQPGDAFPADGRIVEGTTTANESLLTGESMPVEKPAGSEVLAGSINVSQPVVVEVRRSYGRSTISQLIRLTEKAQAYRPKLARIADRVASRFIAGVVLLAIAVGAYWHAQGASDWLAIAISVLVVTCPCALSLATPAALTSAVNALARKSVVPISGSALESLAEIDTVVLDKTGTLTEGRLSVEDVVCLEDMNKEQVLRIAGSLNQASRHPVAAAIRASWTGAAAPVVDPHHDAGGVSGIVDGTCCYVGNAAYIEAQTGHRPTYGGSRTCAWLATQTRVLARFELADRVRSDARRALEALRTSGIDVRLCSGDHAGAVRALAERLEIEHWESDMTPSRKLAGLRSLQAQGHVVAAVGDGVNDAPLLSAADVSIAMGGGADLARVNADMVLMTDSLQAIPGALRLARRTRMVIRENIAWAIGYNLLALPAAAAGAVPPWLAAIGMSLSSLVVVSNALRLNLGQKDKSISPQPSFTTVPG
jgi:Cu2+-exporting ATPase